MLTFEGNRKNDFSARQYLTLRQTILPPSKGALAPFSRGNNNILIVKTRFLHAFSVKVLDQNGCKYCIHSFRKIFNEHPSQKGASFELAPPHEVPKLNERPGRSFDQIR